MLSPFKHAFTVLLDIDREGDGCGDRPQLQEEWNESEKHPDRPDIDVGPLLEDEPDGEEAAKDVQEDLNEIHLAVEEAYTQELHQEFESQEDYKAYRHPHQGALSTRVL